MLSVPDVYASSDLTELAEFCRHLFSSFARSDQRRWAEVYVRGLDCVPGRKSIRRISEQVVGWPADQSLQQFLNQSPWRWEPVRRLLAQDMAAVLRPRAWTVEEVVFPKNGSHSVGVAKQYAHSAGRVLNCQLGLAVLMAGQEGACPVNWRLLLPRSWDDDARRRAVTHVPAHERARSRWQHLLDALDEMAAWELAAAPVLVDARQNRRVEQLIRGLEERGLRYLVQVDEHTPLGPGPCRTAGEIAAAVTGPSAQTLNWWHGHGRVTFRSTPVSLHGSLPQGPGMPYEIGRSRARVLAEWGPGRQAPGRLWLTNITQARLPDLIGLIGLRERARGDLTRVGEECGLRHFEGRSYRGWHHHVTLVSVAHAFHLLGSLRSEADRSA
ncbi:IS701 family transposase [Microbispora sp. H10830]|uniref:IS701 family transposase n=1 Tax=Microbispora sp. H10830 TaxID=2729109 RepID=UPI0005A66B5C|nr:IS701 family transposase [Microbispora sp. H10830]